MALITLVFFLTSHCGLCNIPTVVSEKKMLFDPFDLKSLLDPRQVGI